MTNTRKILIVDDDAELREALVEQLALHEEFESIAVENGTKGVQTAKAGQIDLVIMDVGLPDVDGREAVRILRKNGFKAPIIMLTGHNTDSDTILGLESGANDYVAKPFRFAVLLARIRAQLRQHEASEDAVFTIGPALAAATPLVPVSTATASNSSCSASCSTNESRRPSSSSTIRILRVLGIAIVLGSNPGNIKLW